MTEKNQFDQSSEVSKNNDETKTSEPEAILEKPSEKEEIADLTEIAAEASDTDDDIVDLLDETMPDSEMEDDLIDLGEIVSEENETETNDVIDLFDENMPDSKMEDDLDENDLDVDLEDDDFAAFFEEIEKGSETEPGPDMEGDLIDLTDVAIEKPETDDNLIDFLDEEETDIDIGEDIIDLAEVTDDLNDRNTTSDALIVQKTSTLDNHFVESMGMDLSSVGQEPAGPVDDDLKNKKTPIDLSGIPADQLEETLKRIVDELFSEKIEQMLATFIEKAVAGEIERLKDLLLENPPDA